MEEKKRQIRERSGNDVNLAIGVSIEKDCRNVRTALRKADEDMYEDKRNYYESHPEMKRRHSDAH